MMQLIEDQSREHQGKLEEGMMIMYVSAEDSL